MTTTRPTFDAFLAWLEDSRRLGQVHFDEKSRCWNVLGHPETNAVLSDPAVHSSDLRVLQPAQDDFALFQRGNFVQMDPPQHRKLRTLVSQAFTPKVVAGLEPRIAELTTELLDQVGDRFDLIDSLASSTAWSGSTSCASSTSAHDRKSSRSEVGMPSSSAITITGSG